MFVCFANLWEIEVFLVKVRGVLVIDRFGFVHLPNPHIWICGLDLMNSSRNFRSINVIIFVSSILLIDCIFGFDVNMTMGG
jgi:hypothetical protein